MTTSKSISEALIEARKKIEETQLAVERAEVDFRSLTALLQRTILEENVLAGILERSGVEMPAEVSQQKTVGDAVHGDGRDSEKESQLDLLQMNRMDAVSEAVRFLTATQGHATPGGVEDYLAERGRTDDRDSIGAALSYLRRKGRVENTARGQWRSATKEGFSR